MEVRGHNETSPHFPRGGTRFLWPCAVLSAWQPSGRTALPAASTSPDAHVRCKSPLRSVLGLCSAARRKARETSMPQCARCAGGTLHVFPPYILCDAPSPPPPRALAHPWDGCFFVVKDAGRHDREPVAVRQRGLGSACEKLLLLTAPLCLGLNAVCCGVPFHWPLFPD